MILVDTSVWVAHFRGRNEALVSKMEAGLVQMHPMVILEIGCGTPPNRHQTLQDLGRLPMVNIATWRETLQLIESHRLFGRGCGGIDMQILASVMMTPGSSLWTADKHLATLSQELGVDYRPPLH